MNIRLPVGCPRGVCQEWRYRGQPAQKEVAQTTAIL
jgi:hypothetical protein